jgi:endonuclease VIII
VPEGDTVAKAADALHRALAGRLITRTDFRVPAHAAADLAGQTITEVVSRGKHLLMRTDAGWTIHSHLKMEGAWRLASPGRRREDVRDATRIVIETEVCSAVGTELGIVELLPTAEEGRVLGHLGPDLLGDDWDPAEALRRLRAGPARPIGEALLDQTVMAGLGNIYKSEICFLRGVEPLTPVGETPGLDGLVSLARKLLLANRSTGNQVTTGDPRRGRRHWVYGRGGEPCRRCGTPIARSVERIDGATGDRVTYWCPGCQPVSRRGGSSRPPRNGSPPSPTARSLRPRRSR